MWLDLPSPLLLRQRRKATKPPAWLVAGLGLQAKLPDSWFEALFLLCLCLGSRYSLRRRSLNPILVLSGVSSPWRSQSRAGRDDGCGTSSEGRSASLDLESPKLYMGWAAVHKPSWPGWWGAGGLAQASWGSVWPAVLSKVCEEPCSSLPPQSGRHKATTVAGSWQSVHLPFDSPLTNSI